MDRDNLSWDKLDRDNLSRDKLDRDILSRDKLDRDILSRARSLLRIFTLFQGVVVLRTAVLRFIF